MGASAFIQTEPAASANGDLWKRTDGKDFASVLFSPRCLELLEDHTGADLGPALACDTWYPPAEMLSALELILHAVPAGDSAHWSEEAMTGCSYLYAELSGTLSDFEYFYQGYFVQDLHDLRAAIERAKASGAMRIRLVVA